MLGNLGLGIRSSVGMCICLWMALCNSVALCTVLFCLSVHQPSVVQFASVCPYSLVWLFVINLAALLCTPSSMSVSVEYCVGVPNVASIVEDGEHKDIVALFFYFAGAILYVTVEE